MKTTISVLGALSILAFVATRPDGPLTLTKEPTQVLEPKPGEDGCPAGSEAAGMGPEMVRVPEGFCIDKTEVTRSQYKEWLDTAPDIGAQPAACSENDDFTPSCFFPPNGNNQDQPVVCVDWCDAQAFCGAAGKRLCGEIGTGDAYPFESYSDPEVSEWHAACTSGGKYEYTYGDVFDTDICRDANADDYTTWGMADAGSFEQCHSPEPGYAKLLDLSGHVSEWDNSCSEDGCRIRGGSFEHNSYGTRCAMGKELAWPRLQTAGSVGFRCCAD